MRAIERIRSVAPYGRRVGINLNEFSLIWLATALLFVVSKFFGGGLTSTSILSMLPFASILALAAIGQSLVVQQAGIDFTVIGVIDLTSVVISRYPSRHGGALLVAGLLVVAIGLVSGLLVGLAATKMRITPLIASLGVNALLVGVAQQYSHGTPSAAPASLTSQANGTFLRIPHTLILAVVVTVLMSLFMHRTVIGRRLVLVGENSASARAMGLPVDLYRLGAYATAGLCYAGAGVVLAAYVNTPATGAGDTYLLASISAVVIGGSALTGGRSSIIATAVGALFLSQLTQFVVALGAPDSIQYILQSAAIAIAMGLRLFSGDSPIRQRLARRRNVIVSPI